MPMTISEAGRPSWGGWRKSYLLLFLVSIIATIAVAVSGEAAVPVTLFVLIAFAGLALYLAAPKGAHRNDVSRFKPAEEFGTVADSARAILECVDEPGPNM
jgi:hypothetical protein